MPLEEGDGLELAVSDYSQLGSLTEYLRLGFPGARVTRVPGEPGPGEQGALDVVMLLADSSVLVAAVKVLPDFLRSRKNGLSITIKTKGRQVSLTADNADDLVKVLDRLLDE
jgi:hypothetical protein